MKHKTFPKDGVRKLKETIHELKAYINELEARNDFLEKQLNQDVPGTKSDDQLEMLDMEEQTPEERREAWRKDFLKRVKGK